MAARSGESALYLGIDGGGSRCRTRLRDAAGALIGAADGGAANVYLDYDGAVATIRACIAETLRRASLSAAANGRLRIGLGLAGASSPSIARNVEAEFQAYTEVRVVNDAVAACIGAHGGEDGGLIVAGTGSVGVVRIKGRVTSIGGRGFVLGDDGSGARIGLEAWRRALMAHDGLGPGSPFTHDLMSVFGGDPAAVIRWGLHARSSDYAAYAPAAFAAAAVGDPVALDIVTQAADALRKLADALRSLGTERLALVGGLAHSVKPYLPPGLAGALSEPVFDAIEGAILLVGGRALPRPEAAGLTAEG